ncbi:MAG: hypothetical protein WC769_01640 [Thermodesulfovibrionales bacterium]|jgi:hypothetical protein
MEKSKLQKLYSATSVDANQITNLQTQNYVKSTRKLLKEIVREIETLKKQISG